MSKFISTLMKERMGEVPGGEPQAQKKRFHRIRTVLSKARHPFGGGHQGEIFASQIQQENKSPGSQLADIAQPSAVDLLQDDTQLNFLEVNIPRAQESTPLSEAEQAKYGKILGFITGESMPEGKNTEYSLAGLQSPTVVVSDNALEIQVESGFGSYRNSITLAIPLDKPLSPDTVGIVDGWHDSEKIVSLSQMSEDRLGDVAKILEGAIGYGLKDLNLETLVSIRAGSDMNQDFLASYVQRKHALALLQAAEPFYARYPNSPVARSVSQLREYLAELSHHSGGLDGRFDDTYVPSREAITGYRDIQGNIVPGELLTQPRAMEALGLEESAKMLKDQSQGDSYDIESALSEFDNAAKRALPILRDDNTLLFPQPNYLSFERGKPPVKTVIEIDSFERSYSVGKRDESGNIPFTTDGHIINVTAHLTPDDFQTGAYGLILDAEGKIVEKKRLDETFSPIFYVEVTEAPTVPNGKAETYRVYQANEGIFVQCEGADMPTYYQQDVLMQLRGNVTRKPVIYLYPTRETQVTVKLDYDGKLTNTYPQITGNTWCIVAAVDGTLLVKGKKYKYLFWDGVNNEVEWDFSSGFSVHRDDVESFLEEKVQQMGLNFAEAQDFITYWAPMMKQNEWTLVAFQTVLYEELAKLMISPQPDTLLRIFMVFKKIDGQKDIPPQKVKKMKRKGFTVVEWGGSNLDEVQIQAVDRFIIKKSSGAFLST